MKCSWCAQTFTGRADAKYCSTACRVGAHRATPPPELTELHQWVRHHNKVPVQPTGVNASSTDARTWSTFDQVSHSRVGDGVGFVFNGQGVAGIDLDHCLTNGRLAGWAAPIVKAAKGTYVEISPSGTGLHIFGFGVVGTGRRLDSVEVYDRGRYFTVTMRRFRRAPLQLLNIQPVIDLLV